MTREELLSQAFKDENGISWIPIDTSSNQDSIDLLRSGDHIIYKCKNCGLELKKYYDVRHKESTKESLCQSCRMTKCEDRSVPIIITNKAQLDNLKYGQKFTYNCIKCGKTCTYDFRPQRKNLYSTMMCGECRVHSSRESNWNYNGDKEITLNITDYGDFDSYNIRNGQKIHYICKGCGADVNVRFSHGEDNKREDGLRRMLCSICAHKDTYNKMYGGNITSNLQTDEIKEQIKQTNLNTYGVDHYSKTDEFKEMLKEVSIEQFGEENRFKSDKFKTMREEASMKTYGTKHPMQNKIIQNKVANTNEERYGNPMYLQSDAYKEENMKKYGTCYPNFNRRFKYSKWGYDCLYFASYWEFCVYLYFTEIEKNHSVIYEPLDIPYYDGDRIAYYQLDFLIDGRMIEIKGDQYLDDNGDLHFPYKKIHGKPMKKKALESRRREWANKNICMKLHNIEVWSSKECLPIIKKVEEYFGKEWLNKFEVPSQSLSKEYKHEAALTGIINNGYYFTKNTMPIIRDYPYIKYNYGISLDEICNKNTINNTELNKSYIINGKGIIPYI